MLVKASHLFSKAPNTTFFILLFIIAPEHMTQGSSVTYNVHSSKYQDSNFLHASFIAKISACAVARFVVSRKLCAHEITSLFLTITAPTGS